MSNSPRHLSPATSQIFERDVQEGTTHAPELSPAIPSHIQTEDHIPPVLDASSHAITEDMQPDEVEIVTHSAHQPAAVTLASGPSFLSESHTPAHGSTTDLGMHQEHQDHEEMGSPLGAVDPQDPRRLSFISFADVVNSEHIEGGKDSALLGNLSSGSPSAGNRSPSPVRSPASNDRIPITPPTSGSVSFHGLETSPVRGGNLSSLSVGGSGHGELTIETMRQALKKTGSNELTGTPSQPLSATSADDGKEHFLR